MNKKLLVLTILFLAVAILAIFALANNKKDTTDKEVSDVQNPSQQTNQGQTQETNGIILFYGDGCPHCAIVEEYVNQNGIEAKVSFAKKEVYYNKQNADELIAKAKACSMSTNSIGVPFLWDGSTCLVGDQDIIEFFKSKINGQ